MSSILRASSSSWSRAIPLGRIKTPTTSRSGFATMQQAVRASYYRGGTSRAVMFTESDLPSSEEERRNLFLQAMGTPDPYGRQLDGFGAGISSLSKICVVGQAPATDKNADVTYTFVGLGIETPIVDTAGNCGNMSSAIGPYAFNQRLLGNTYDYALSGTATVRIFNTNTNKYIRSTFPVSNGQAEVTGSYAIDGVSGTGARIKLDFLDPSGAKTGKLLPTGSAVDVFDGIEVSCVDSANPMIFVRAADLDIDGAILPAEFAKLSDKLELLERLRTQGAVAMGMAGSAANVPRTVPKIAIVSGPKRAKILSGELQAADGIDVLVRFISDGQPHRAIPLTGALCTASAARVPGSVVNQCIKEAGSAADAIRIGHASGRIEVGAALDGSGGVKEATVYRTAKRIMDGEVYWVA